MEVKSKKDLSRHTSWEEGGVVNVDYQSDSFSGVMYILKSQYENMSQTIIKK